MSEPFLIAHKVRGQPAFDIAERMVCPECDDGCDECDSLGYWWIIPTSGHRARPYRYWSMDDIYDGSDYDAPRPGSLLDTVPHNWPDHYRVTSSGRNAKITTADDKLLGRDLLTRLGLIKPQTIARRL